MNSDKQRVLDAIEIAVEFAGIDGEHHKTWVIDQMVRKLAGEDYDRVVSEACACDDGVEKWTGEWDTGIAP